MPRTILSPVILGALQWLAETRWSIALHESLYVWPLVESAHVLSLTLFVGTAFMLDLRLLGLLLPRVPASSFTGRLLPWTRLGFVLMVVTGVLLFYASPVRTYQNLFFRAKMLLLGVAGLNVWLFHARTRHTVAEWATSARPPRAARLAAVISLVAWTAVVVSGRLIAYNWFDCDIQPQRALVNWAAGCVVPPR
jgi:hypothetical protein